MSLFVVALAWFAALGVTAFAAPGDSGANATSLNDYVGASLTTKVVPSGPTGFYYFKVLLAPGQTLQADFTSFPGLDGLLAIADPFNTFSALTPSVPMSASVQRLTFSAPSLTSQTYTVYVGTSSPGTFTVEPRVGTDFTAPVTTAVSTPATG